MEWNEEGIRIGKGGLGLCDNQSSEIIPHPSSPLVQMEKIDSNVELKPKLGAGKTS